MVSGGKTLALVFLLHAGSVFAAGQIVLFSTWASAVENLPTNGQKRMFISELFGRKVTLRNGTTPTFKGQLMRPV